MFCSVLSEIPNLVAFDKLGLKIVFKLERPSETPDLLVINMLAQNVGSTQLTEFLFQAAVPKVNSSTRYE